MTTSTKRKLGQRVLAVLARLLRLRPGPMEWGAASPGDDDGGSGVREPRVPVVSPPSSSAARSVE